MSDIKELEKLYGEWKWKISLESDGERNPKVVVEFWNTKPDQPLKIDPYISVGTIAYNWELRSKFLYLDEIRLCRFEGADCERCEKQVRDALNKLQCPTIFTWLSEGSRDDGACIIHDCFCDSHFFCEHRKSFRVVKNSTGDYSKCINWIEENILKVIKEEYRRRLLIASKSPSFEEKIISTSDIFKESRKRLVRR